MKYTAKPLSYKIALFFLAVCSTLPLAGCARLSHTLGEIGASSLEEGSFAVSTGAPETSMESASAVTQKAAERNTPPS